MKMISVTDIADFKIGNAENSEKGTGCTVIICEKGAVGGVDVRGGGPATRETDLLRSENTVNSVNAVVLSGGSAFGLEAASGVMRELADMKIGFDVGDDIVVPIVCGASLYDLPIGDHKAFPDVYMGTQAVRNAYAGSFARGNHGAGTGATVGKLKGYDRAMKSGIGAFACGDGVIEVGAVAAVNAVGDIYNGAGNIIAGLRSEDGKSIYGTIKTLKSMVYGSISQNEESAAPAFIDKSNLQEALAAAARQLKEEESLAESQVSEAPAEEPEEILEEPAEETAAEFVFEAPAEVTELSEDEPEEPAEEVPEETEEEPAEEVPEETEEEPAEEVPEEPEEAPAEEVNEEPFAEAAEFAEEAPEISEEAPAEAIEEPDEEPAEEVPEEPFEEVEEPEEEFIPETPEVSFSEENYREYAEISIPVISVEPEAGEEPAAEEPVEEVTEEPEESFEETVEVEAAEEIPEEPVEVYIPEEIPAEVTSEEYEEPAEETSEIIPEESVEEYIPEEIPAGVASEEYEKPAEEFVSAPVFEEIAEAIVEEEEPVSLTREEMGYDIVFNTTISCLITNAALTKSQANKLASILHDAYARAIKPVHGTLDGDTVFVLATGKQEVNFDAFAALATDVMQYAIIDGAMSAESAYGLPAARDMQ